MTNNNIIELVNVTKSFDGDIVLDNINLKIKDGEFITLLGPSGCGKTTTLRIIGGFLFPDSGSVFFMEKTLHMFRRINGISTPSFKSIPSFRFSTYMKTWPSAFVSKSCRNP